MWDLDNRTPFPAFQCFERDKHGAPHWLVTAKATFELRNGHACLFASEQRPLAFAPLYRDTDAGPELLADVDVGFPRTNTDIILSGTAKGPGRNEASRTVEMSVGSWSKRIAVGPPRRWSTGRRPEPETVNGAEEVWLGYSEAFGGRARDGAFDNNPIGRGFAAADETADDRTLPRLSYPGEFPRSPGDAMRVAGFGPVPRDWAPRKTFAGTYDEAWQRRKSPFLPDDFDIRFLQTAPEDQQWNGEMGPGLPVRVTGLASGDIDVTLPVLRFECLTRFKGQWREQPMRLQALQVFADEASISLTYCGSLEVGSTDNETEVAESRLRLLNAASGGFSVRPEDASRFSA